MSCKRISRRARAEQDYWLYFSDIHEATEEERMDFLHYDTHGGDVPQGRVFRFTDPAGEPLLGPNPIYLGKVRREQYKGTGAFIPSRAGVRESG